jgi:uncharacterized membrane protein HdeD (DUF308 family)
MPTTPLLSAVAQHWWAVALRGVLGVLFGFMAFAWPGLTLAALVLLYGAYALTDGIFAVVAGARGGLWGMAVVGLLGIAAGVIAFLWPGITALALLYVIAFSAIARGVFEIVAAIALRKEIEHEWLLGTAGALSIAFGVLVALFPGAGALSLVWVIGAFAMVFGVTLIVLGFRLRTLPTRLEAAFAR